MLRTPILPLITAFMLMFAATAFAVAGGSAPSNQATARVIPGCNVVVIHDGTETTYSVDGQAGKILDVDAAGRYVLFYAVAVGSYCLGDQADTLSGETYAPPIYLLNTETGIYQPALDSTACPAAERCLILSGVLSSDGQWMLLGTRWSDDPYDPDIRVYFAATIDRSVYAIYTKEDAPVYGLNRLAFSEDETAATWVGETPNVSHIVRCSLPTSAKVVPPCTTDP